MKSQNLLRVTNQKVMQLSQRIVKQMNSQNLLRVTNQNMMELSKRILKQMERKVNVQRHLIAIYIRIVVNNRLWQVNQGGVVDRRQKGIQVQGQR